MKIRLLLIIALTWACAHLHAAEYASLDITREDVVDMLWDEGVEPTRNRYPPVDGEPYDEVTVREPLRRVWDVGA